MISDLDVSEEEEEEGLESSYMTSPPEPRLVANEEIPFGVVTVTDRTNALVFEDAQVIRHKGAWNASVANGRNKLTDKTAENGRWFFIVRQVRQPMMHSELSTAETI